MPVLPNPMPPYTHAEADASCCRHRSTRCRPGQARQTRIAPIPEVGIAGCRNPTLPPTLPKTHVRRRYYRTQVEVPGRCRKPTFTLPTSANPRLMMRLCWSAVPAEDNPDSCSPTLQPMPETTVLVLGGNPPVLYSPDTLRAGSSAHPIPANRNWRNLDLPQPPRSAPGSTQPGAASAPRKFPFGGPTPTVA